MWLDKLKEMKAESGFTTKEIADKSGIPEPTLEKLFAGATKDPKLATMQQLVHFLGFTLDDLSEMPKTGEYLSKLEKDHIKKYRLLDPYGKEAVDSVLDVESRRCEAARAAALQKVHGEMGAAQDMPEKIIQLRFKVPGYSIPMSAGTGQEAGQEYPEDYVLTKEQPRGTSYIATVSGNSMEPTYHDGDLLFIHACEEVAQGQIGVFLMDGQQWVKELGDGELISHNEKYAPIPVREDIRCQGLVLGVCDESYFEQKTAKAEK